MVSIQAGELRVVSYNIHHGRGMDGRLDLKRIAEVIRKQKPDLVALQEVDRNVTRSGRVDELKKLADLLGMHYAFGKTIGLQGGEYGNAVLSKYPINETVVHQLPGAGEPRVMLEVVVVIDGQKHSFCSVHLEYGRKDARLPQAKALSAALLGHKCPVIVAGDFNASPQSDAMKLIRQHWHIVPKSGAALTMPADKPIREIDYIITRNLSEKGAVSRVIEEKVASDHRPVSGVVKLP